MRQIEPDPTAQNRVMMGPDGTVHVVPAQVRRNSPSPAEMEDWAAAEEQAGTSSHTDVPSQRDLGLRGIRRVPAVGVCFSYSAPMPLTDRDVARRAVQDIRRIPQNGVCFSY